MQFGFETAISPRAVLGLKFGVDVQGVVKHNFGLGVLQRSARGLMGGASGTAVIVPKFEPIFSAVVRLNALGGAYSVIADITLCADVVACEEIASSCFEE